MALQPPRVNGARARDENKQLQTRHLKRVERDRACSHPLTTTFLHQPRASQPILSTPRAILTLLALELTFP